MKNLKKIGLGLLIVLLIASISTSIYFYLQYKKTTTKPDSKELENITGEISKFMDLPEETPSMATITDKTKLKDQTFFVRAENGDKVLIYVKAQKAILFRPSMHKIIDVAPINVNNQVNPSPQAKTTESKIKVSVALYNGTKTTGVTTTLQKTIEKQLPGLSIKTRDNAKKNTYEKTIVVDVKGSHATEAQELAKVLGAEVSELPEGETAPAVDILVIVGAQTQ